MPEYYVEAKHLKNENIVNWVGEHCNIRYFLKLLVKAGFRIKECHKVVSGTEAIDATASSAAQSVR